MHLRVSLQDCNDSLLQHPSSGVLLTSGVAEFVLASTCTTGHVCEAVRRGVVEKQQQRYHKMSFDA